MVSNKTGSIILLVMVFLAFSAFSVSSVLAPPAGCITYNDNQPECESTQGCYWQDSCYGSVSCDSFDYDQSSCSFFGCSWDPYCVDNTCFDEYSCTAPYACGSSWNDEYCDDGTCTDQSACEASLGCASTWDGFNCADPRCTDQTSCEASFGCGSSWNYAYCDDGSCGDEYSCEAPHACGTSWITDCNGPGDDCSNWNGDSYNCGTSGCSWQDSCAGFVIDTCGSNVECNCTKGINRLNESRTMNSSDDLSYCPNGLQIGDSNLILDCNNLEITGGGSNYGIDMSSLNNITIQNCSITNYDFGINMGDSNNITIDNNTIHDFSNTGIYGYTDLGSDWINITGNEVYNGLYGMEFNNDYDGDVIEYNYIHNLTYYGINLIWAINANVRHNVIDGIYYNGIVAEYVNNSNFTNNTMTNCGGNGFYLYYSHNNTLLDNTLNYNGLTNYEIGLRIYESSNNTFDNNVAMFNNIGIMNTGSNSIENIFKNQLTCYNSGSWDFYDEASATITNLTCNNIYGGSCDNPCNTAPEIVSSRISPSPTANANLMLKGYCNSTDFDYLYDSNVKVRYYYTWYVDGAANKTGLSAQYDPYTEEMVSSIPASYLSTDQNWTLNCTAYDGTYNSTSLNSSETLITVAPPATEIDACMDLDQNDTTYVLNQSISTDSRNCFNILGSGITLDCAGYSIIENDTNYNYNGIYAQYQDSLTIENCNIENFSYGIYFYEVSNSMILNNIFSDNYGIYLEYSDGNTVDNNDLTSPDQNTCIYLYEANSNTISNNNETYCWSGIYNGYGDNNAISNNIADNCWAGIYSDWGYFNTITNVNSTENDYGILMYGSDNTVADSYLCNNSNDFSRYDYPNYINDVVNTTCEYSTLPTPCSYSCSGAPLINSSRIVPSPVASLTDTLEGYCSAVSQENVSYYYTWYLDDQQNETGFAAGPFLPNTEANVASLSSTSELQKWNLECYASNTTMNSSMSATSDPTIIADESVRCIGATQEFACGDTVNESCTLNGTMVIPNDNTCLNVDTNNTVVDCDNNRILGIDREGTGIYAPYKNNITVKNCIMNKLYAGVDLYRTTNSTLTNNTFDDNSYGIQLDYQSNRTNVNHNNFIDNSYGVYTYESDHCSISNNNFTYGSYGVQMYYSSYNNISDNEMLNNYYGVYLYLDGSLGYNIISNNNIIHEYYYSGYGIFGGAASNNTIQNNYISNKSRGIYLSYDDDNNTLSGNNVSYNYRGIQIGDSSNQNVFLNTFACNNTLFDYSDADSNTEINTTCELAINGTCDITCDGVVVNPENQTNQTHPSGGSSYQPPSPPVTWTGTTLIQIMKINDVISFMFGADQHKIKLIALGPNFAVVQIASTPFNVQVDANETEFIDINKDGIDDISIRLEKIENRTAYFIFDQISEAPETAPAEEQTEAETKLEISEESSMQSLVVIVALAMIALVYLYKKKKINKKR